MAEYIEREATLWLVYSGKIITGDNSDKSARELIKSIPTADVRPVVRGKWLPDYDYMEYDFDGSTPLPEPLKFQDGWQCSLCGEYTPSETNYCPNCGADMRMDGGT